MNEFIEKLIGRLEELYDRNDKIKKMAYEEQDWEKFDLFTHRCEGIYSAIPIVKGLAEEYNNGWIACSERLPENTDLGYFLVWCKGYFTEGTHIGEECQWYGIGLLYNKNKWKVYQCKDIKDIEVIAWQPLPAPYKKGE